MLSQAVDIKHLSHILQDWCATI